VPRMERGDLAHRLDRRIEKIGVVASVHVQVDEPRDDERVFSELALGTRFEADLGEYPVFVADTTTVAYASIDEGAAPNDAASVHD